MVRDPFGRTFRERLLRRAAGGGTATALLCVGLGLTWLPDSSALGLVVLAGVAATALSWPLEARAPGRRLLLRYGLLGAGTAAAVVGLLADGGLPFPIVTVAATLGAAGGVAAAGIARHAPRVTVGPLGVVALVACALTLAVVYRAQQPPFPGSYLQVTGPSTATGAQSLAEAVAKQLSRTADPLSDGAWSQVAGSVVQPLPTGSVEIGYEGPATERRITVAVDAERACVVVTPLTIDVEDGACHAPARSA